MRPETYKERIAELVGDIEVDTSDDFRFAAAVAAWGMLLRDSEHCGSFTLEDVSALAAAAVGEDAEGYRRDFVNLVERARGYELLEVEPGERR